MLHDYLHLLNYQMLEQELNKKINETRAVKTQLEMERTWRKFVGVNQIRNDQLKRKTA